MSLTPNGLRVLESIGVYSRIKSQGFDFEAITFMTDPEYETTGKLYFGQKDLYGYDGMRITRKALNHELTEMAKEAGVEIHYGKKFTKIIREDAKSVTFEFTDGSQEEAELLIGADGIYSKVRSSLFPDIYPQYSGHLAITYCLPRANVDAENLPLPVSLRGKQGSFILSPQAEGGRELLIGRQLKHEQRGVGRNMLFRDDQEMIDIIQQDPDSWSPLVQDVQAKVTSPAADALHVWPFYTVPKMDRWHSSAGRVIILGDAAHAVPPPAGQGANQALEDSYSLAILLANLNRSDNIYLLAALSAWEAYRMERMEKVLHLTNRVLTIRMTEEERTAMPEEMRWDIDGSDSGRSELGWLYLVDIDRDISNIVAALDK